MNDEHANSSARLIQELVDFDESLAEGSTWIESRASLSDEFDEAEAELLSGVKDSLALIDTVRHHDPTLFDAPGRESADISSATIGRFQIIRELGRGGFGVVLLAHDPNLDRRVALKLPLPDVLLSSDLRNRFLREGKAAAALRHPHIVSIFEAAKVGPICYLVCEYCEGPSLAEWLRDRNAPVDPRVAARLVRDLALGLQHAHEQGVIHCDLKPGNILLQQTETSDAPLHPRITDFGMARLIEAEGDQTRTGSVLGTPAYMAPEQAAGNRKAVGPPTEIFSLGVILYELLSGKRPFQRESILATLHAIQHEMPTAAEDRCDLIPPQLNGIVQCCLAKNPDDRYTTAADLATDLECYLSGKPTTQEANSTDESKAKQLPRNGARIAVTIAAALGLTTALISIVPQLLSPHVDEQPGSSRSDGNSPVSENSIDENDARNRRVCNWILSKGGQVAVAADKHPELLMKPADVPNGPFEIHLVTVSYMQSIDEARFQDLLDLPHCTAYLFAESVVSEDQLQRLAGKKFDRLMLYHSDLTDDTVRHVRGMNTLEALTVRSQRITDASLPHVARIKELAKLELLYTGITSDGLRRLADLPNLQELNLGCSANIGDEALKHLYPLKSLRKLNLKATAVTEAGIQALKSQRPNIDVKH